MIDLDSDITIPPISSCRGSVKLDGSKSISNRLLLLAALSDGKTKLTNLLISEDTQQMINVLSDLGIRVDVSRGPLTNTVVVHGGGGVFPVKSAKLFLGNAGTAFRPLTAVLSLSGGNYYLYGVDRMHERPIGDLISALRQLGAILEYSGMEGYPPIQIQPGEINPPPQISVKGDVSSQFLTSLLIAAPLLKTKLTIKLVGKLISSPYISITINLMQKFGVQIGFEADGIFEISDIHRYKSPGEIVVEGDASNASYFFATSLLGGGPIKVKGIGRDSIQGDIKFLDILGKMGVKVWSSDDMISLRSNLTEKIPAFDLDLNDIPDAAMTLAVVAIFCDGKSFLRNIGSWRVKETDRIAAMATELRKTGATVEELPDEIHITAPDRSAIPRKLIFDTYDDHRMAMALSLVAFAGVTVTIRNPRCVRKTFPSFFDRFCALLEVPIVTIDGPAGSGKGTIARGLAKELGFHYLDSGLLYRLLALVSLQNKVNANNEEELAGLATHLKVSFSDKGLLWENKLIGEQIRSEAVSKRSSKIASYPSVRKSLLKLQHQCAVMPGLIADGRDMGTVVFPKAVLKIFLTASLEERARRRYKQLIEKGLDANLRTVMAEIGERDNRDINRKASPLSPADDAKTVDSTEKTPKQVISQIVRWFERG